MSSPDHLVIEHRPALRRPVLLAAFAGWNDASQVATFALRTLRRAWSSKRFAYIPSEPFFVFTEARPLISLTPSGQRSLEWPANEFFAHQLPESERDVILLIGTEPHLKWQTFCRIVVEAAQAYDVSTLVTLGGFLADVPHTFEPRLSGFASGPDLLPQLEDLGVQLSSYQGPTGIIGALYETWGATGRPALGFWGHVPHYISAAPNPRVTLALLRRVETVLGLTLPLEGLETSAQDFTAQIDEALLENPEARDYVEQLEQNYTGDVSEMPAPKLIDELEEFLRSRRPPPEEET